MPGPERNIAFLSSCKQNPFLLLEHSLEIDSAYIGLPTALQPLGLRFPFSSARRDASFSSLRLPSCRARGFLFRFHRAAPTVCRGALCNVVPVPSSLEKAKLRNHEADVGTRVRWRQGHNGAAAESIFPRSGDDLPASKNFIPRRIVPDRMNNSSLRNFEDAPLRLNLASRDRRTAISDLCPEADTRALAVANLHGNSTRVLLLARTNLDIYLLYGRSRFIYFYGENLFSSRVCNA